MPFRLAIGLNRHRDRFIIEASVSLQLPTRPPQVISILPL